VFALGLGDKVVGVDITSQYPPAVSSKPQLGNFSSIAPEPVLAARPTVVIAPAVPATIAALTAVRAGGIPVVFVPETTEFSTGEARIRLIADALGVSAAGDRLIAELRSQVDRATALLTADTAKLRVIYLTFRNNQLSVFGQGSAPHVLITKTGAVNVVDELGLKTGAITTESLIAAKPDVILFPSDVAATLGGAKAFAALPGVAATPAGTTGQVFSVDATRVQSLGPRTGEALGEIVAVLTKAKAVR
jgi:iron complex transport system substrate-binding protein